MSRWWKKNSVRAGKGGIAGEAECVSLMRVMWLR